MTRSSSYRVGLMINTTGEINKVTYDFHPPVRERSRDMDALVKHIHGNEAFSLENVAKAMQAARAKRNQKQG